MTNRVNAGSSPRFECHFAAVCSSFAVERSLVLDPRSSFDSYSRRKCKELGARGRTGVGLF